MMECLNKIIKKQSLVIVLFFMLYACGTSIDRKIVSYIETNCIFEYCDSWLIDKNTNFQVDTCGVCYIDLRNVLKIDFDRIYVFGETTTAKQISKVIGIPYTNNRFISDSRYRIIFFKNNKIVHEEDFYLRFGLHPYPNRFKSFGLFNLPYSLFTSPIFRVRKTIRPDGSRWYALFNVSADE